jgi:hypothetical protein
MPKMVAKRRVSNPSRSPQIGCIQISNTNGPPTFFRAQKNPPASGGLMTQR